ncbi:MAG TPA: transposase [Ktedonobacteraceae bacterium]|nr:transposase [Ktedonobacteraceae bacterium]
MKSKPETIETSQEASIVQDRLNWKLAWRDDTKVAQGLYAGEEIEEMHELSDAGLLDEFFVFLEEVGMMQAFEQLRLPGVKRVLVPTVQFVLLYLLKVLFGGQSMHELPRVLFSNLGLMELIGLNAHQCEHGLTTRGDAQRTTKKKQGPLTAQCLANNISKLGEQEMEYLFNQMVSLLAQRGLFSGKLVVALDGSKLPTPKSYAGCGKLKQTRSVKVKGQKEAATEEYYVYGWKVLVLIEVQTRLPLAMKLVKIQEYEGKWLVPLLEQAQQNLGEQAQIETIVIDRGYLDGEDLWRVHQKGVFFVICGKSTMAVTQDAQGLAKSERASERDRIVRHGHGKTATEQRVRTVVVGVEALTSYDQYGDAAHTQHAHRSDYVGQPINAVVVRKWENRVPQNGGTVYLTNADVRNPFHIFDTYDWRSVIENGIFKEGKHPWHLLNFPKRTEAAVVVHCFFTLLVMALCTAFRLWQAKVATTAIPATEAAPSLSSALLGGEGTARWRQRLREENRDKIIVFVGHAYGIFHLAEFALLTHLPLRRLPSALGSPQAVLHRFGISP